MSIAALKQEIARLNKRDRREIFAYLVQLRHDTAAWKRATARRIRKMCNGNAVSSEELERRIQASWRKDKP